MATKSDNENTKRQATFLINCSAILNTVVNKPVLAVIYVFTTN